MFRLFVAIRPPAAIRAQLLTIQGGVEGARWQDDDQLHLTLRYIGEVERRTAEDIATALADVRAAPMTLALSGVGVFEHKGHIDTLWAGVTPAEPLAALHKKIDHALVRLGLPAEGRAYRPHITLARGRMRGPIDGFLAAHGSLSSEPFAVTQFTLFESRLGNDGATYEIIADYPLG